MEVRRSGKREGRPRHGAPQWVEWWSARLSRREEGGASRRRARAGRPSSWRRERPGAGTPPGSERGAGQQRGHAGTWERPWSAGHDVPADAGSRGHQSPGVDGPRPAGRAPATAHTWGQRARDDLARAQCSEVRGATGRRRAAAYRGSGRQTQTGTVGNHGRRDPLAGRRHRAARRLAGKTGAPLSAPTVSTPRQRMAEQARQPPALACTALAHRLAGDLRRDA
jgi:hypothetical protein